MSSDFTADDTTVTTDVPAEEGLGLNDPGLDATPEYDAAAPVDTDTDLTAGDEGVLLVEQSLDGTTNVYVDSDADASPTWSSRTWTRTATRTSSPPTPTATAGSTPSCTTWTTTA